MIAHFWTQALLFTYSCRARKMLLKHLKPDSESHHLSLLQLESRFLSVLLRREKGNQQTVSHPSSHLTLQIFTPGSLTNNTFIYLASPCTTNGENHLSSMQISQSDSILHKKSQKKYCILRIFLVQLYQKSANCEALSGAYSKAVCKVAGNCFSSQSLHLFDYFSHFQAYGGKHLDRIMFYITSNDQFSQQRLSSQMLAADASNGQVSRSYGQ